jgi:1-acyl-sn-glycerol-3-phosphate acyltransferase
MKRIVMLFIRCAFLAPIWYFQLLKYGKIDKYDDETRYKIVRKVNNGILKRSRVSVVCTGLENLPKDNGYIMFPNHQGLFDMLLFLNTHVRPLNVVIKKEARNIHLLRRILNALDALAIDREDVRQSMTVIAEMTKRVKEGKNFVIFPEGTRSKNGNIIGTFKGGSFKAATKSKCPIVPVALIDSFKPFDCNNIKKCTVQIHYLPAIYYDEYKDMKTNDIALMVQNRVQDAINEHLE